jgi:hypothetical protein
MIIADEERSKLPILAGAFFFYGEMSLARGHLYAEKASAAKCLVATL